MRRRNIFEKVYYWLIADDVNNDLGAAYLTSIFRIIFVGFVCIAAIITFIKYIIF